MSSYGLIILAAGASTRMGSAKQSLPFNGKTLLQHTIDVAVESDASPILIVLKSNAMIQSSVPAKEILYVHNHQWETGIASSIRNGISRLIDIYPFVNHVILMVCDQPYVTSALINRLVVKSRGSNSEIVACSYAGTLGTPAVFSRRYFSDLLSLSGDRGAKKIIMDNLQNVAKVSFPLGHVDIDTKEDYARLMLQNHKFHSNCN